MNPQKNPHRVLVVDDDEAFRCALKSSLESEGYQVTLAANGKAAQALCGVESFDTVLSDIKMAEGNGIELLHFIKRTKPMPVILMTGFAELAETKEAYDLGADEFIAKPFKREDLLEAVKLCCLDSGLSGAPANLDGDYCKLSIDDFVSGRHMQCDIFIRLSASKYVKIAHKGADLSIDQVKSYKSKNIRYLYMKKDEFRKYVGMSVTIGQALKTSGKVSTAKKLQFLKHTGEVILENLFFNEVDKEVFDNAKTTVETTVSVMSDLKDIYDLLGVLNTHSDHLYAHSLGVSLYSVMIAREMGWNSSGTVFKLSLGGLLHDVGKKEIDKSILAKGRKDLTPDEIKLLESHTVRGMEILSEMPSIQSDVVQIAMQHHETCNGLGYPSGLKQKRIHPLARLVAVANEFCNLALKSPSNPGMSPQEAINRIVSVRKGDFDPAFIVALAKVFKLPPPVAMDRMDRAS